MVVSATDPGPGSGAAAGGVAAVDARVPAGVGRIWRHFVGQGGTGGSKAAAVRIVQFNVLAEGLSNEHTDFGFFTRVPRKTLEWGHRREQLLDSILQANPTVVCLEECDHYLDWWVPAMSKVGFTGIHMPKSFPTVDGVAPDGCAIFVKNASCYFMPERELRYAFKGRNQVLLAAEVMIDEWGSSLVVGVTHLKAGLGKESADVRDKQTQEVLQQLQQFSNGLPATLCCDFNGVPTEPGYLRLRADPILCIASAYGSHHSPVIAHAEQFEAVVSEPEYTTWQWRNEEEIKVVLDYIFFTAKRGIRCTSVLDVPDAELLPAHRLPCDAFPSDHVLLAADFVLDQSRQ